MANQDSTPQKQDAAGNGQRRSLRGFAAMDPQRQREIASLGGRAAHQSGHAHEFTTEEARAAGKKRHAARNAAKAGSQEGSGEGAR
ncbi:MAG TPA: KGG domain-containing protein [Ramlibacter sp.]|nr:KGG domain-containing protein [Ramlibacter sp.]